MEFLEVFYTRFVPIFLFTVMVAMGLSLTIDDLLEVVRKPKAILIGLVAQLGFLPVLAISYGFLESYAGLPKISMFWAWGVIGASFVLGQAIASRRYR